MKTISVRIVLFTVMCLVPFCSFSAVDDDMCDSELRMDDVFHDEARTYYHIIKDNGGSGEMRGKKHGYTQYGILQGNQSELSGNSYRIYAKSGAL